MSKQNLVYILFGVLILIAYFYGNSGVKVEYIERLPDTTAAYIAKIEFESARHQDTAKYWENTALSSDSTKRVLYKLYKKSINDERTDNYDSLNASDFELLLRATLEHSRESRFKSNSHFDNP